MKLEIVRDKRGGVVAAAHLDDDGIAPDALLEEGQTTQVVEVRRLDLVEDAEGVLKRLG